METIKIIGYYEDELGGVEFTERYEEIAYLISEDVAVTQDQNTIYFLRVSPSREELGAYDDGGILCDICVLNNRELDIANLPIETLVFAKWAADNSGEPIALAV